MSEQQPKHSYNEAVLHSALEDIVAVASGERQLIDADDAEGLAWVDKRARTALANYRQTPQPPTCAAAEELERVMANVSTVTMRPIDAAATSIEIARDAIAALRASEARVAVLEAQDMRFSRREPAALRAQLAARDQAIQRLREALDRKHRALVWHGMHTEACAINVRDTNPCDCGFDSALTDTTPTDKGDSEGEVSRSQRMRDAGFKRRPSEPTESDE